MSNKLNVDGIMLFEQPFARVSDRQFRTIISLNDVVPSALNPGVVVKVPYENYRKVFRTSQKQIEKDFGPIQTIANDLNKQAQSGTGSSEETIKSIDNMISRIENLKRKVRHSYAD